MALKRSALADKVKVVTVTWEDETLDVGVYPGRYTTALIEQFAAAQAKAEKAKTEKAAREALNEAATLTASLFAWWDITEDDGSRMPVTPEAVVSFPFTFMQALMEQAGAGIRPPGSRG